MLQLPAGETEIVGRGRLRVPDGSQPGPDTLFEIGSITKTFTSSPWRSWSSSGTVSLRTPLRDLLPAGTVVPRRDGTEITLEHLARHTSGLPRSPNPFAQESGSRVRGRTPTTSTRPTALDSLSRLVSSDALRAGALAAIPTSASAAGHRPSPGHRSRDYFELIRATVLLPLQLSDTVVEPTAEQTARLAQGHGARRQPVDPWYLEGLAGAGALRSTATDLLGYLRAQMEPDRTPLAEAIRLTHPPWEPRRRMTIGLGWIRTSCPTATCGGTTAAPGASAASPGSVPSCARPLWCW